MINPLFKRSAQPPSRTFRLVHLARGKFFSRTQIFTLPVQIRGGEISRAGTIPGIKCLERINDAAILNATSLLALIQFEVTSSLSLATLVNVGSEVPSKSRASPRHGSLLACNCRVPHDRTWPRNRGPTAQRLYDSRKNRARCSASRLRCWFKLLVRGDESPCGLCCFSRNLTPYLRFL